MSDLILVGRVVGAFGVKGEVRIHAFTADPLALRTYKTLLDKTGAPVLTVTSARDTPNGVIANCKDLADRDIAEAMKGRELYVRRADLPPPDEDEFYITDLVGLEARSLDGEAIGMIAAVENHGAGDLLDIKPLGGGPSWLLEFTRENAPAVDIAGGFVTVVRPVEED